jgi:hypothetical protein
MAKVEFHDYTIKVKEAIADIAFSSLEEAAGELESQVKRNTRVASSDTKNSWKHRVTGSMMADQYEAQIGSPLENAIWEEFGTGEHALDGKGRRGGYWVYVKGSSKKSKTGKTYTLQEAKRVVAIMRKKGLDAYYTNGKKPSRALYKAYTSMKNKIIKMIQDRFKGLG